MYNQGYIDCSKGQDSAVRGVAASSEPVPKRLARRLTGREHSKGPGLTWLREGGLGLAFIRPTTWSFSAATGNRWGHAVCTVEMEGAQPGPPHSFTASAPGPRASLLPSALLGASAQPQEVGGAIAIPPQDLPPLSRSDISSHVAASRGCLLTFQCHSRQIPGPLSPSLEPPKNLKK